MKSLTTLIQRRWLSLSFLFMSLLCANAMADTATDIAKSELNAAAKNIEACVSALDKAGDNPLLDAYLNSLNPNTAEGPRDTSETYSQLKKLIGKPLEVNANQVEMCLQVLKSQLQLVAANKQQAQSATLDGDVFSCPSGTSLCPGGSGGVCCTSSDVCAYACAPEGGPCSPYCEHKICFPSNASVRLEDGSTKFMYQLEIGDRVQVVNALGMMAYEDIYMMTHNDAESESQYLEVSLASGQTMTLSPRHFIPTAQDTYSAWKDHHIVGANELQAGDIVWYQERNGKMYSSKVVGLNTVIAKGAFNPLTASGTIVVDGVVASAHSDWFLDGVFSADTQATIYQAMFMPVRGIYHLIGPKNMTMITQEWGVVDFVREATETPSKMVVFLFVLTIMLVAMAFLFSKVVAVMRYWLQRQDKKTALIN